MYQVKLGPKVVGKGFDTKMALIFVQGILNSYRDVDTITIEKEKVEEIVRTSEQE